ncbi:hypothetical protein DFH11DRAFT_427657 [Phellopilus nigrolimitatus]|nr:hypothetical protein DFH11DRAFT_200919 [Phellopilus nigrolimitatus]KAH8119179.1 hypothetical protein DFH11DRAFT_427657 [Phellopilus nigrolimitatus]
MVSRRFLGVRIPCFVFASISEIYSGLKKLCDSKLGIAAVCMQMASVRKEKVSIDTSSIALQINTKLGGVNHQLDASSMCWLKNTMLVGMNLTHPDVGCIKGRRRLLRCSEL